MAMHVSRNDRHLGGNLVEINVTPLVDVMLVLLIIFMVTAPLMSQGIDVDLPSASTQAIKTEKDDVVLTVLKNGSLFVQGDKKTSFRVEELAPKLTPLYEGKTKKKFFFARTSPFLMVWWFKSWLPAKMRVLRGLEW